jgi:hypothetical protein
MGMILRQLKRELDLWRTILRKRDDVHRVKRFGTRIYQDVLKFFFLFKFHRGVDVLKEGWDYLIILDGCRYDMFSKLNDVEGALARKVSRGSNTWEWARKNFKKYHGDIIYISANPVISHHPIRGWRGADYFFQVVNVWDWGWSANLRTVHPKKITETALRIKKLYPDKKLIIHYLQPHAPWVGRTKISVTGRANVLLADDVHDAEKLRRAYEDNLYLVLKYVKKLISQLDGKIVITSDHGELMGEWFLWGHPQRVYIRQLVEIPWLTIHSPRPD